MGPRAGWTFWRRENLSFLWEIEPWFHIFPTRSLVPVPITLSRPSFWLLEPDYYFSLLRYLFIPPPWINMSKNANIGLQGTLIFFVSTQVFNRTGGRRGMYIMAITFFLINLEAFEMIKQKLPNAPRLLRYACIS